MQLYFQSYPEVLSRPEPIIIIPGLFGSSTNWRSFAKALSNEYDVYVVDQRNHGRSPHADSQSYADMAADLLSFLDFHSIEQAVLCGHSMGGKTAMVFSLLHPERVKKLAVLDIAPTTYLHSHAPFLESLLEVDLSQLQSRAEADRAIVEAIPETATRLFLLQNLTGSPGRYRWRINLAVLHEYMTEIVGFPSHLLDKLVCESQTAFIHGELSDYVGHEHRDEIDRWFPNAEFVQIAAAGHWLHVDQPTAVQNALEEFLKK